MARKKVEYVEKVVIAETLFYILYHIEVPLVCRLALKIAKKLQINLKADIRTPLDLEYRTIGLTEGEELKLVDRFRIGNAKKLNNVELISCKIANIFKTFS